MFKSILTDSTFQYIVFSSGFASLLLPGLPFEAVKIFEPTSAAIFYSVAMLILGGQIGLLEGSFLLQLVTVLIVKADNAALQQFF